VIESDAMLAAGHAHAGQAHPGAPVVERRPPPSCALTDAALAEMQRRRTM
jgi:hypothetical protein